MRSTNWCNLTSFVAVSSLYARLVTKSEVQELTDEYFNFKIREDPWFATKLGIDKYQDQVEDWNHAAFDRRIVSQ